MTTSLLNPVKPGMVITGLIAAGKTVQIPYTRCALIAIFRDGRMHVGLATQWSEVGVVYSSSPSLPITAENRVATLGNNGGSYVNYIVIGE